MKKIVLNIAVALLLATSSATHLNAQVTIGADQVPQAFSVLELISNQEKGLRLPQMTTVERNLMTASDAFQAQRDLEESREGKALGLQIFNTTTHCVETWNGEKWLTCLKCLTPPVITTGAELQDIIPDFPLPYGNLSSFSFELADNYIWTDRNENEQGGHFPSDGEYGNYDSTEWSPKFPVQLEATGSGTITWILVSGNLPPGLTLNPNGVISGIPQSKCDTDAGEQYEFTVKVTDAMECSATKMFSIRVESCAN